PARLSTSDDRAQLSPRASPVIATRSPRDGAPVAGPRPTASPSSLPAETAPPPAATVPSPVVAPSLAPLNRRERVLLAAGTVVGSFVLRLAEALGPEAQRRKPIFGRSVNERSAVARRHY